MTTSQRVSPAPDCMIMNIAITVMAVRTDADQDTDADINVL